MDGINWEESMRKCARKARTDEEETAATDEEKNADGTPGKCVTAQRREYSKMAT
jgi:hypothetical protein